jgi:hypothetical protein
VYYQVLDKAVSVRATVEYWYANLQACCWDGVLFESTSSSKLRKSGSCYYHKCVKANKSFERHIYSPLGGVPEILG